MDAVPAAGAPVVLGAVPVVGATGGGDGAVVCVAVAGGGDGAAVCAFAPLPLEVPPPGFGTLVAPVPLVLGGVLPAGEAGEPAPVLPGPALPGLAPVPGLVPFLTGALPLGLGVALAAVAAGNRPGMRLFAGTLNVATHMNGTNNFFIFIFSPVRGDILQMTITARR